MFSGRQPPRDDQQDGEVSEPMQGIPIVSQPHAAPRGWEDVLIDEARAGDAAAFGRLFDQYHAPITTYLQRLTGDRDAADDLAQETFIKAWRALGRTDAELSFRAWLYRIATNTARSWQRRRNLLTWLPLAVSGPDTTTPSVDGPSADAIAERELIDQALRRVGSQHASILLLRHHQRLTLEETAQALDVSVNTAKVRLFRARKAFTTAYDALSNGSEEVRR